MPENRLLYGDNLTVLRERIHSVTFTEKIKHLTAVLKKQFKEAVGHGHLEKHNKRDLDMVSSTRFFYLNVTTRF